jgi:hypothetical protein
MSSTATLEDRLSHVERDLAQLKSEVAHLRSQEHGSENPWLKGAGMFRDDPLFEEWQRAIAEYRREVDRSGAP